MIEEVIHRAQQINGVDEVVVAIPEKDAAILERYISVRCVKGAETDVLSRYVKAAKEAEADVVMRITADCPMLSSDTCSTMLLYFALKDLDYLSNAWPVREVPHGWDCEIMRATCLDHAHNHAADIYDREHVTPHIQRSLKDRDGKYAAWKMTIDLSRNRWTLDTLEDYRHIYQVMQDELASGHRAA